VLPLLGLPCGVLCVWLYPKYFLPRCSFCHTLTNNTTLLLQLDHYININNNNMILLYCITIQLYLYCSNVIVNLIIICIVFLILLSFNYGIIMCVIYCYYIHHYITTKKEVKILKQQLGLYD
jgi:hypothetical protein